jgi:2-octaprenyl-6-methoxyphenol hydroxylase
MKTFEIAICGAGPVGQALALLLIKQGFNASSIALIDAKTAEQSTQDARTIALSYGSQTLLQAIYAAPQHATAIEQIHVSRRCHFGRTLIGCTDYQLPALGYVARYRDILAPLQNAISQTEIAMLRPKQVDTVHEHADHVEITFTDGSCLRTAALIQAEGGTFGDQAAKALSRNYQQTAVIAHVQVSAPIPHRAFERFTEQGPLALLPQDTGYSLVWCVRPDDAHMLLAMDDAQFLFALQTAFGERVGRFMQVSKRVTFPLGLNAQAQATARTVNIGNAAQTLHPVAGQGLNLGLRDATVLAREIGTEFTLTAFTQFQSLRDTDRRTTIGLTDTMARVFTHSPDGSLPQGLLGLGLGALDLLPAARNVLAQHMLFGWR